MVTPMNDVLQFVGVLEGHRDWVTCIRTSPADTDRPNTIVSTSRDKKVMIWKYGPEESSTTAGYALKCLSGHSQPVSDLALSSNGRYALTGSWDKTLRLWDLETATTLRTFKGHTSDVNSVALSADNRQIVSGSRDCTIRLWNTMAQCKNTIEENKHKDWVNCVRFSPSVTDTLIVSCGSDKAVKVWDLKGCNLKTNLMAHTAAVQAVTISPDGSLCASGGKDGVAMLWDVNEGKHLYSLAANSAINSLCFSPCHYWLCAATNDSIKIWNLEDKEVLANVTIPAAYNKNVKVNSKRPSRSSGLPWCVSLTWSADGHVLFAGSTDGRIYVYQLVRSENRSF